MLHKVSFRQEERVIQESAGITPWGKYILPPTIGGPSSQGNLLYRSESIPQQKLCSPSSVYPVSSNLASQIPHPFLLTQPAQNTFIVVIDDSPTVRKILETCLGREGFQVISFEDGVEALRWLLQPDATLPALIILDVGLPKMDGYDVARSIKTRPQLREIVILFLSGRGSVIDRLKGRLVGAKDYLTKPFTTQDIIVSVQSHLGNIASTER